jgi:hypothetical protein
VFVRAELGTERAWVGQPVALALYLYSAERVVGNPALADVPSLSSFWVEEVAVDPNAEATRAVVEGRTYQVYPLLRRIVVPQTPGKVAIDSYVVQIPVQVRGDPFVFFSFGRARIGVRRSLPLELDVLALPTEGRPPDFGGAVGRYTLSVNLDRTEATINDAVSLAATVEGEGFLRAVPPPSLDAPPDLKVFDPKVNTVARAASGRLLARKTWEWVLVPLVAGELRIPELRFSYFDVDSGSYRTVGVDPPTIVVGAAADGTRPELTQSDIRVQRRDLAFIKLPRGALRHETPRLHERGLFWTVLLLPLLWSPLLIALGRHRARMQQNLGLARARRARSRARQRLRDAAKHLGQPTFHEQVARALVEYVADRFDRSAAGLSYEVADELLGSRGFEADLRRRFRSCLEACDFARFVPAAAGSARQSEVLDEAIGLIEQMERAW